MTNEEKAIEIAEMYNLEYEGKETSEAECYESALEMAEWKDQQFKDIVQEVKSDYMCLDNRSDSAICALDSVLNILKKINND